MNDTTTVRHYVNNTASVYSVIRIDSEGRERRERVRGFGRFSMNDMERAVNESRVADPKLNPFRNGQFSIADLPVDVLTVGTESPNLISESEMRSLASAPVDELAARLAVIDSEIVLNRLAELAGDAQRPVIADRLAKVSGVSADPVDDAEESAGEAGDTEDPAEDATIVSSSGPLQPMEADVFGTIPEPEKVDYYKRATEPVNPVAFTPLKG